MSVPSGDYSNSNGGSSCDYSNLCDYNAGYGMGVSFQGKSTSGVYLVPNYPGMSYDTLTAKIPSCSGYADINNAYGKDAANCQTVYRTSLCGGGNCGNASMPSRCG